MCVCSAVSLGTQSGINMGRSRSRSRSPRGEVIVVFRHGMKELVCMLKSFVDRRCITRLNCFVYCCQQIVLTDANLVIMIGRETSGGRGRGRGMVRGTELEETGTEKEVATGSEKERGTGTEVATGSEKERGTGTETERETTEERTEVSVCKALAAWGQRSVYAKL